MEFGLIGMFDGCCCAWSCTVCDFVVGLTFYCLPIFWMCRFVYRLCKPLSDGNLIRIEFPLPQILPSAPYEPLPVSMLVGCCSEAKRCAYCHEDFDRDSARRFCFACKSATHEECAVINGGCSVFGCTDTTLLQQA